MGCLLKQGGGLYPRLRIGAVLLAAGEGRRMGGVAKPLIRLQGVPLISRQLVALSGAGVDEVVVVTGHARHAIEEQVRSFVVTLAHNDSARRRPARLRARRTGRAQRHLRCRHRRAGRPAVDRRERSDRADRSVQEASGRPCRGAGGERPARQPDHSGRGGAGPDSRQRHEPRLPPSDRAAARTRPRVTRPPTPASSPTSTRWRTCSSSRSAPVGGSSFQRWRRFRSGIGGGHTALTGGGRPREAGIAAGTIGPVRIGARSGHGAPGRAETVVCARG